MFLPVMRRATPADLREIYTMGYDTWGEGKSIAAYLDECLASPKYKQGRWFVLTASNNDSEDRTVALSLLASAIVYEFSGWGSYKVLGIGSLSSPVSLRGKGYGKSMMQQLSDYLLAQEHADLVFIYSDIDPEFYARMGYVVVPSEYQTNKGSTCMVLEGTANFRELLTRFPSALPKYF